MLLSGMPPCEVLRSWPGNWDVCTILAGPPDGTFPDPSRFLHRNLAVQAAPGKNGRCVRATAACKMGELVLVDAPLLVANSRQRLVAAAAEEANAEAGEEFRELLLSLCGDPGDRGKRVIASDDGFVELPLVERIVAHNYHVVDRPPLDGLVAEDDAEGSIASTECGLWPLASIVNHSLHPNVARTFAGHATCYRLLRDLAPGEELLDNYLDPRLPCSERTLILRQVHGISDEGPDEFDAPEEVLVDLDRGRARVQELLKEDRPDEALQMFADVVKRCQNSGCRDPACAEVFRAFADLAQICGSHSSALRIPCLTAALENVTVREAFSSVSCLVACELLAATLDCLESQGSISNNSSSIAEVTAAAKVAREHCARVYGAESGIFELLNPALSQRLSAVEDLEEAVVIATDAADLDAATASVLSMDSLD